MNEPTSQDIQALVKAITLTLNGISGPLTDIALCLKALVDANPAAKKAYEDEVLKRRTGGRRP